MTSEKSPNEETTPKEPETAPKEPEPARFRPRRTIRQRIAFFVLIVGAALVLVYYTRNRPSEVEFVLDFGAHRDRVTRVEMSVQRVGTTEGEPVVVTFPEAGSAPRRFRHTLTLDAGTYSLKAYVVLRANGEQPEERRTTRKQLTIKNGTPQRVTLRFGQ